MADKTRPTKLKAHSLPGNESAEVLRGYYEQMSLVRAFELRASEMYARAKIGGYCHLNLGEEATVVGLMAALEPRDYLFTNYREHGYALARGMEPGRVMAELFGKTTGVSRGRGGSMHLFDIGPRMLGGYGIVGGQLPLATGAALAMTYRSEAGPDAEVVMCQMGDGTTNIGAFHESLNLAGALEAAGRLRDHQQRLGMGTPVDRPPREPDLYKRGCAYRIAGERVDGDDVAGGARRRASRAGQAPRASGSPRCWRHRATACGPLGGRPGPLPLAGGRRGGPQRRPGPGVPRPARRGRRRSTRRGGRASTPRSRAR